MSKFLSVFLLAIWFTSAAANAVAPKTYQVTGPVLEVTDSTIVIQKSTERWEIARDAATKVVGDLKVGSRVTIFYRMMATDVDVKPPLGKIAPPEVKATAPATKRK